MFAIIIGLIVIALVVTLLLKGYYPQAILFMGGVVLLTCTAIFGWGDLLNACLLYTSPSPRDGATSRMPSSA